MRIARLRQEVLKNFYEIKMFLPREIWDMILIECLKDDLYHALHTGMGRKFFLLAFALQYDYHGIQVHC